MAWVLMQSLIAVVAGMAVLWAVSLWRRDASLVDRFWGVGFAVVASVVLATDGSGARAWLLTALALLWGVRLSIHITRRNWAHGEDPRYQAWRRQAGARFWWVSLFSVFLLQGLLLFTISLPLQLGQLAAAVPLSSLDVAGAAIWALGFAFETIGDWQLARFKSDPAHRGQVMDRGLWRYTRHPNYFGDALVWWGFYLIAAATPLGVWSFVSPLLMTVLLVKVSGVALLEKTIAQRRPAYAEYARRTSAFLPWRPRQRVRPAG